VIAYPATAVFFDAPLLLLRQLNMTITSVRYPYLLQMTIMHCHILLPE